MALQKSPPPFPLDPRANTIQLPSEVVHELFHLVQDGQLHNSALLGLDTRCKLWQNTLRIHPES